MILDIPKEEEEAKIALTDQTVDQMKGIDQLV